MGNEAAWRKHPFQRYSPNIGIALKDHQCKGGNVWLWTDANGKPIRALCAGCNEYVDVVYTDDNGELVDMIPQPNPREASRQ